MIQRNRILLVDDNVALVDNLYEILTEAGYEVMTATSCATAPVVAQAGFDVGLIDLRLPDGTGTELLGTLQGAHPNAEFILLTGDSTVEAASAAVRAGAFAYLQKPCATDDLLLNVRQAMRQVEAQVDKHAMARRVQVAEQLAAIGTMTAGLSHEIRNPLNAAGLQLSVLERRIGKLAADLQPPLMSPLRLVRDEIERLDHLLQDFLNMARPREPKRSRVELGVLVGRVLDFLDKEAERRSIHFGRHFEAGPTLELDEDQMRRVVMNLCLNALEASGPRTRIDVTIAREAQAIVLLIDDAGPGVPAALRERIFEPFFTTKATGSGLGLPIVSGIVAQHGGTLTVTDAPSGGARFVVSLPAQLG